MHICLKLGIVCIPTQSIGTRKHPKITQRLKELREEMKDKTKYTQVNSKNQFFIIGIFPILWNLEPISNNKFYDFSIYMSIDARTSLREVHRGYRDWFRKETIKIYYSRTNRDWTIWYKLDSSKHSFKCNCKALRNV